MSNEVTNFLCLVQEKWGKITVGIFLSVILPALSHLKGRVHTTQVNIVGADWLISHILIAATLKALYTQRGVFTWSN